MNCEIDGVVGRFWHKYQGNNIITTGEPHVARGERR